MSFIDVAIPSIIGLIAVIWPQTMFWGARVAPDPGRIRLIRGAGVMLLVVALGYLAIRLIEA